MGLTVDTLLRFILEEFNRVRQNEFDQFAASLKLAEFAEDGLLPFNDFYEACKRSEPTARNTRWIEKAYCYMVSQCRPGQHNENDIVNAIIPLPLNENASEYWYFSEKNPKPWEVTYKQDSKKAQ